MIRNAILLTLFSFLLNSLFAAQATPADYFSYVGVMVDNTGLSISGVTTADIKIDLFTQAADGTSGYSQTFASHSVHDGVFELKVGPSLPDLFTHKYMEVTVNNVKLSPRIELHSAATTIAAQNSQNSLNTARFGNQTPDEFLQYIKNNINTSIADGSITSNKISTNTITSMQIATSAITTTKIADSAINTAKVADNSVTSVKIADAAIATAKIADSAISTAKLADSSITSVKLANDAITTASVSDNAITTAKIANDAIVTTKIAGNSVTNSRLADSAVTAVKLADNAVITAKIANAAIDSTKLADGAVATAKLADNSVTTAKIAASAIAAANIADGAVTSSKLADGSATGVKLGADVVKTTNNLSDLANTATARTNLGLGTMAIQNTGAVAITGGNINGTVIGATTAANGTFQALNAANVTATNLSGSLQTAIQSNITKVGTLTDLTVQGNGTFNADLTATGKITANQFYGDGSNLTNLPSTSMHVAGTGTYSIIYQKAGVPANKAGDYYAAVYGGAMHVATGRLSSIINGQQNYATVEYATVLGGYENKNSGIYSLIGNGYRNQTTGKYSLAHGRENNASGQSSIAIGEYNKAEGTASFALGQYNEAKGYTSVALGYKNIAGTNGFGFATGYLNQAIGKYSSVIGGSRLIINGQGSGGMRGGDGTLAEVTKTAENTFYFVDQAVCVGTSTDCAAASYTAGTIYAKNNTVQNADYAEYFLSHHPLKAGDVVGLDRASGKTRKFQPGDTLLGIVSTKPGIVGNAVKDTSNHALVALMGQVPFNKKQTQTKDGMVYTLDGNLIGTLLADGNVYINIGSDLQEIRTLKEKNKNLENRLAELEKQVKFLLQQNN
jgi:hypothetical protein